jgi:hypothetical protein
MVLTQWKREDFAASGRPRMRKFGGLFTPSTLSVNGLADFTLFTADFTLFTPRADPPDAAIESYNPVLPASPGRHLGDERGEGAPA